LQEDTQLLKKVLDGRGFAGAALPCHGAGDADDLGFCVRVPSTESFYWERNEFHSHPLAFFVCRPHLPLLGMLQAVARVICRAL
jgi:hypothetical protein